MTKTQEFWIEREPGQKNYFRVWDTEKEKKGIVLIVTGLAEHIRRYEGIARFLNEKGFIVAGGDHRGQGQTALRKGKLGNIELGDFKRIVSDQRYYIAWLKEEYCLPVYILAHSFGSFVCQKLILQYSEEVDGVVLMGSAKQSRRKAEFGTRFLKLWMLFTGKYYNSKFANDFIFEGYNDVFLKEHSKFSWLSSDCKEVERYVKDPLCGYPLSNSFLYELSEAVVHLYHPEQLRQIRKNLPILILSGAMDPMSENGKRVLDLYVMYRQLGIRKVEMRLFNSMRHELLNEVGKEQVYDEILGFLNDCLTDGKS